MIEISVSLRGGIADTGEVPAFASLESLHGFSQAAMMTLYFAKTGEFRRRGFAELEVDLRLVGTREGSFEFLFQFVENFPYLAQIVGEGVAAAAAWDLIKAVFNRATGGRAPQRIEGLERQGGLNSGDLGALVQAAETSIRKAHTVVNHGANSVSISIVGDHNAVVFDPNSKEYMYQNIVNDEIRTKRFLVTSYDGRNRTGRVFDIEAEQAFTFDLMIAANRESLTIIVDAARAYALREQGRFDANMEAVCAYTSVDAPDGRPKRLRIFAAASDFGGLEVNRIERGDPDESDIFE